MPTMPNVVGLNYQEAQDTLQAAGIYQAFPVYAFLQAPQITVAWQSPAPITTGWTADSSLTADDPDLTADSGLSVGVFGPGVVMNQLPASGATVIKGAPLTLTVATYPMGAVISPGY